MRALSLPVSVLAAALLLTACDSGGDSEDGAGSGGQSGTSASAAASSGCAAGKLTSQVGPVSEAPAAGDTGTVTVTITNNGAECTLKGFPKVELHAADTAVTVPGDPAAGGQELTLPEQGTASFTVTYVRGGGDGAKSFPADRGTFTLPGASGGEDFPWSYGEVALKGESEPDASVSGFQQAGD